MEQLIRNGLEAMDLLSQTPAPAPAQLAEYGRLLLEKNQVMNLTAITEPERVAQLHMLDSAALLKGADFQNKTLIDVGTGAGFPGIPLKILVPSLQVTLLDSLNKRVDWLGQVCAQLALENIRAIHARAEEQALVKGFLGQLRLRHRPGGGRPAPAVRAVPALCQGGRAVPGHEVHRQRPGAGGRRPLHQAVGRPCGGAL